MQNVATSVRIAADANCILSELAAKLGQSKAQVIEKALKELEERIFWNEVTDAFARTASDSVENVRQNAEVQIWENVSHQDFQDETW